VGIAEQNMVTVWLLAAATTGMIPYVATFASFLGLLCCEHIRTDCAYPNLPVRLTRPPCRHFARLLWHLAPRHRRHWHHRAIANLKIVCPADAYSLEQALRQTVDVEGPIYFRLGREASRMSIKKGAVGVWQG
jgi:transketolase